MNNGKGTPWELPEVFSSMFYLQKLQRGKRKKTGGRAGGEQSRISKENGPERKQVTQKKEEILLNL